MTAAHTAPDTPAYDALPLVAEVDHDNLVFGIAGVQDGEEVAAGVVLFFTFLMPEEE